MGGKYENGIEISPKEAILTTSIGGLLGYFISLFFYSPGSGFPGIIILLICLIIPIVEVPLIYMFIKEHIVKKELGKDDTNEN